MVNTEYIPKIIEQLLNFKDQAHEIYCKKTKDAIDKYKS